MYSKPPSNFDALLIFGTVGAYRVGHCIITNLITRNNQKYSISLRFTGVQHLEGREALVAFETDSLQEASQMDDAIHEVLSKLCLAPAQACVHRRTLQGVPHLGTLGSWLLSVTALSVVPTVVP